MAGVTAVEGVAAGLVMAGWVMGVAARAAEGRAWVVAVRAAAALAGVG